MKASTLQKRLSKINVSKTSISYKIVKRLIDGELDSKMIRPCYTSGRGRFMSNMDYTGGTMHLLNQLNVKYKVGNDSPKGGKTGNFINVISKIEK